MEGTTNSVQMLHFWSFLKVIILLANCAGKRALSQFPPTPLSGGSWPGERYWRQWRRWFFMQPKKPGVKKGFLGVNKPQAASCFVCSYPTNCYNSRLQLLNLNG